MPPLIPELRSRLRTSVLQARRLAEKGARQALHSLAVDAPQPFSSLSLDARPLRNALRARGRQLGDVLDRTGKQSLEHLALECAYEHWHRMLFARFLAENHLLLHPEGVPVSLDEVRELAAEENPPVNPWTLAARWAARMLPAIFRPDDPVLQIEFAPEDRIALEKILADLPSEVFTADDSLGWVYQFWQEEKKDEINRSEVKIGAEELPAVTQLFTESYMVKFLLHNTLGAWWVSRHGGPPPIEMEFLRFLDDGSPAAGGFAEWPNRAAELKCLDPCCGSGHFLVEMLRILVAFRMKEEGKSVAEAVDAVLRKNLFGLEIDPRCTQIAAFAVALAAWKLVGGYRPLPHDGLHIACSGLGIVAKKDDWLRLAGQDERLRNGMDRLWTLFQDAPTLGSLIDPRTGESSLLEADWSELRPLLAKALAGERDPLDAERSELAVTAKGIADAAEILAGRYTLVATNVPYLARAKQGVSLRSFCEQRFPKAKPDLATVFVGRCLNFCEKSGAVSVVTPQNWLFLSSYGPMRKQLLTEKRLDIVVHLGPAAFRDMNFWAATTCLTVISNCRAVSDSWFLGMDVSSTKAVGEKSAWLKALPVIRGYQRNSLGSPDTRILLATTNRTSSLLLACAKSYEGLTTGDLQRFTRSFWEFGQRDTEWEFFHGSVRQTVAYGGREQLIRWSHGKGDLHLSPGSFIKGREAWGRRGIRITQMNQLSVTLFTGELFDKNAATVIPNDLSNLPAIFEFCSSQQFRDEIRRIDQKVNVTIGTLVKVPFDLAHWQAVAAERYPNGLPEPYSEDPTQWIFKGTVTPSTEPLQVAVARLLGYRWPDQQPDALETLADRDGIVCLPPVGGELPAAERLRALLAAAYGDKWSPSVEVQLLTSAGFAGKNVDDWLRDGFFEQHCKLFHNRPFIWHIWDGRKKDGFAALVNYHRLDRKLLEKLTYSTLGDWITQLRAAQKAGDATAEARIAAALDLKKRLELILEGEPPYDIFVRWKPLEEQPIGWEPDINDGVRLNIRPFMTAGVLRKNPNIKWEKDRGKNPPGSPWGEDRINDRHLTLKEKREAREKGR